MRDIKRRIKSIKNTEQITKAMKMVAAAKLRKAQDKVFQARPYARELAGTLSRLAGAALDSTHPLMVKREVKKVAFVVVTADRGLCGGYNANIIRKVRSEISAFNDVSLICVGRKGRDFFRRIGVPIIAEFTGLGEEARYQDAKLIAETIVDLYLKGEFDEVYVVYTEFFSALTQRPKTIKLLPVEAPAEEGAKVDYIYEPNAETVLSALLPKYLNTTMFRAMLEAKASEHGARMTAMGSATDNAKEMIAKLTLNYNRARQAAITKEISEIVGGAAALE
ncbi:ATP synthase F1 subcomplex gamma subunit [Carboxydocella sporoproducens DSM 16521]|uniref:ATP synthase gamma chain n=3 Tax=Clostridiales Family XVI. Incertae Sedis TaxID=543347 RepID=A0A1T4RG81_9FIRM|nr:ATP synthase F1 subcomplex gamma subunit [Carboxydocella thermautotrophica]AVX29966.1 ATP synthase F1 subcomplex gamma subunit [Carboxydocella thermautotrophica]GAW29424.1 ATP synthase subunit gamma [Carboxydocella sp. ULO1]SKA15050.1 ATP synthase F1 subcomplex gamma subunit [Carboxydocella sporoproducens DSM 16521]